MILQEHEQIIHDDDIILQTIFARLNRREKQRDYGFNISKPGEMHIRKGYLRGKNLREQWKSIHYDNASFGTLKTSPNHQDHPFL